MAFARLYGYLRYFHPSDEAAGLSWVRIAINGVAAVKEAARGGWLVDWEIVPRPTADTIAHFVGKKEEI